MNPEGRLTHIGEREGLSTNFVTRLYGDPKGDVYVCSNFGLNRLSKTDGESWKVYSISTKQGLPSNLINDVTMLNGELWIATSKGLAHLREIPKPYPVSAPVLEKFLVNNLDTSFTNGIQLPHNQNNITIGFHSIHFRSEGNIIYRYRLPVRDTIYTITNSRQVNFANLSPGSYTLEVQAQNEDGLWGEKAIWSFAILRPWWRSWWFVSLMILLGGLGVFFLMNRRLRSVRNTALTANKIKDLELAALRAQMNPHFIFNCLGSIQQFIVENDKASATRYLSRFAKLVRLSLHSSVDGRHTLKEEVAMLDNYLALEQMRFTNKFTYTIQVDPAINDEEIYLPPMLVQPFVENAVLHGRPLTGQGLIEIEFRQQGNMLHILVSDNGPGISNQPGAEDKLRKSFGMSLTRRRLDLLSNAKDALSFTKESRTNNDGSINGTRIVIRVPIA